MTKIRVVLMRILGLFGQHRREREMDAEVQHHLDMLAERYMREGLSAEDAWRAARREFGRVDPMKETYRRQRSLPLVEVLVQDLRYGIRSLRKSPVFTAAALLSLALGIGVNSAIFSVVNAVLLRPLPYPESDRLVQITRLYPNGSLGSSLDGGLYYAVADGAESFEALTAHGSPSGFNLASGTGAEYMRGLPVTSAYFDVLGTPPHLGRAFLPQEDAPNGGAVVIVSHAVWQRFLDGDPDAIGRSIRLSGEPHTVIGVMPEQFRSVPAAEVWTPLQLARTNTGAFNYTVIGRLADGVEHDHLAAELLAITEGVRQIDPNAIFRDQVLASRTYQSALSGNVRVALLMLLGAVSVVLLIACVNVANLFVARAVGRSREIAIRAALGAGRSRIAGQLMAESLLVAAVAGVLGLLMAWGAGPALLELWPSAGADWRDATPDARVFMVTLVVSLGTGLLFGTLPSLTYDGGRLATHLRDDGTRTTQSTRASWLRGTLVVSEVALAVVLLVGAGLLVRSFVNLRSVDLGFQTRNIITAQMSLNSERYRDPAAVAEFQRRGLERIQQIPGIEAAAIVSGLPVERGLNVLVDVVDGVPTESEQLSITDIRYATPDYFAVLEIPVVAGRSFGEGDLDTAAPVALVNREFARRYLAAGPMVGERLQIYGRGPVYQIVGVVGDVEERGIGGDPWPVMYIPVEQAEPGFLASTHRIFPISWLFRARPGAGDVAAMVRQEIRALDPLSPFSQFRSMDEVVAESLSTPRFHMILVSLFSGLAILLATAGIYGVMTYTVSVRMREIGVRIAIGASAAAIVRAVVGQGVGLASIGVVLGLAGAAALTRVLDAFVFGVTRYDATSFLSAALCLLFVAVVACAIPAFRAARVDPVRTLRTE